MLKPVRVEGNVFPVHNSSGGDRLAYQANWLPIISIIRPPERKQAGQFDETLSLKVSLYFYSDSSQTLAGGCGGPATLLEMSLTAATSHVKL
jgi:hypothetical protein